MEQKEKGRHWWSDGGGLIELLSCLNRIFVVKKVRK
jgi:hypothetical protein